MKRTLLASVIGLALTTVGCGADSSETQQNKDAATYKDAAVNKDAPAAGSDVLVLADTKDLPAPTPDTPPDAPLPKDVPPIDLPRLDVNALDVADTGKDVVDVRAPIDTTIDTGALDGAGTLDGGRPILDAQAVDLTALTSVIGFPCRNDSDCCITIDNCMNVAYLYSKAPGAALAPEISPPPGGMCTACIAPTIQVSCVSGQCVGTRISSYPAELRKDHCGYVKLADAGTHAPLKLDAGALTTKSSWSCGGN
jgi:hypothetical protein